MSLFKKIKSSSSISLVVGVPFLALALAWGISLIPQASTIKNIEEIPYNPAFDEIISAYTSDEISKSSPIRVRFLDQCVKAEEVDKETNNPFSFSPSIEGKCKWIDTRTIEFKPEEYMNSDQVYTATVKIDNILEQVVDSLSTFTFQFKTIPQNFRVEFEGRTTIDEKTLRWQRFNGSIITDDYENDSKLEKILTATQDNEPVKIKWEHDENGTLHKYTLDSLKRGVKKSNIKLEWDGKEIGVDKTGNRSFLINALGDFNVEGVYVRNSPEQYIEVEFSDPLKPNQSLKGLVELKGYRSDLVIDGNKIKIFPRTRLTGKVDINIAPGIQNILGYKTKKSYEDNVAFSSLKPEVRIAAKGTIVPLGNALPFEFEAVSLSAVDISIIKINESNIPQFLQVNQLNGSREMKRVGQILFQTKVNLNKKKDLGSWNKHVIDLNDLIKTEPGAIYEVSVGFRKSYSLYGCSSRAKNDEEEDPEITDHGMLDIDDNIWAGPGYNEGYSNWNYWEYGYNYEDREDPCTPAYYHSRRVAKKNILASGLGLLAKHGADNKLFVSVTDIKSTSPLSQVELELYDYQHQLMAKSRTDVQGFATIKFKKKPFLIIAKQGKERGYLRLDDGNALSMSRFDVAGKTYYKGLKGYWYGERGVWRPGDPIYMTFVLEDKLGTLPDKHPITIEFRNPHGQLLKRNVLSKSLNGFYTITLETSEDDITGDYAVVAKIGSTKFTKSLKVETIVPNRLKIEMDFEEEHLTNVTNNIRTTLKSRWLHGANAGALKADVSCVLTQSSTQFKTHLDYTFDDPTNSFSSENTVVFDGKLNDEGEVFINKTLGVNATAPGMLKAHFKTKVFEEGGAFSTDRFSIDFHPFNTYVGLRLPKGDKSRGMLLTDTNHTVRFVTLNPEGNKVPNKRLKVAVYKMDWRWWWDKSEEYHYNSIEHREAIQTGTVRTDGDGEATWKLRINYPDWGRYLVRVCDEDGHCSGKIVYIDWPGWAGRAQKDNPGGAKMLTFTSDKSNYQIGEDIQLHIPMGAEGRALVSIENGTQILNSFWVNANSNKKGETIFGFKAARNMAPNAYAHVTYIQPHAQTKNDRPIRLYGVIPLNVNDPKTHLSPKISMANTLAPNTTVSLKVSEKEQRAMTYTIAIVDEGLLDITRFKTPDLWKHFHQRQALGVKTWDLFDEIIGADHLPSQNLLSIGGGDGGDNGENTKLNRFKPMVKFMGPYHIQDGQSKSHKFKMPNYVGSVRTMVIGGYDGAYGSAEKTTPVKKPLMVLATLPRVLGPDEVLELPVNVFAMSENIKSAQITVHTDGFLKIQDQKTKTVTFSKEGDKVVNFKLKVNSIIGTGKVKVEVVSGKQKAVYETDIEIRMPNPATTKVLDEIVQTGNSWNVDYIPHGVDGTNKAVLEFSTIPPMNLEKRLNYLIRYPYGCVEQTTSSVFPQLHLAHLIKLSAGRKKQIDRNIALGIKRLLRFQNANGGLSYWPGHGTVNDWGTNYAGHFMVEAQKAGYAVPAEFISKWTNYQKQRARSWSYSSSKSESVTQAYRLYLLALSKNAELGAMNRLSQSINLPLIAKWYLAAAYQLAGQPEAAGSIANGLSTSIDSYNELGGTYGSRLRDKGIILLALSEMNKHAKGKDVLKDISNMLCKESWYSTQTTAYCLIAVAKYVGVSNYSSELSFKYQLADGSWKSVQSEAPIEQRTIEVKDLKQQHIAVKNTGNSLLFARLIAEGVPPVGNEHSSSNNLDLNISYLNMNGGKIAPESIKQGTDFMVEVTVHNPTSRNYEEMVINQIFPSGWEIHNERMDGAAFSHQTSVPEYRDIRDDRVYTFFDLGPNKSKTFRVALNATYAGRYYLPKVYSEAMYDKSISASRHGQWISIHK